MGCIQSSNVLNCYDFYFKGCSNPQAPHARFLLTKHMRFQESVSVTTRSEVAISILFTDSHEVHSKSCSKIWYHNPFVSSCKYYALSVIYYVNNFIIYYHFGRFLRFWKWATNWSYHSFYSQPSTIQYKTRVFAH